MTKKEILDYVMHTPYNTNRQVLSTMLDAFEEELSGGNISKIIDKSITTITSDSITVGDSMFQYCESLKEANFPEATVIESYAFNGCKNLIEINFPKVICVGSYAFSDCGLSRIEFPIVEHLHIYAFYNCEKLETAIFPKLVEIGSSAFGNCQLKSLVLSNSEVCVLSDIGAFANTPIYNGEGNIYVPAKLVAQYQTATNWIAFANKIKSIEEFSG